MGGWRGSLSTALAKADIERDGNVRSLRLVRAQPGQGGEDEMLAQDSFASLYIRRGRSRTTEIGPGKGGVVRQNL